MAEILDRVNSPEDLKSLPVPQLSSLAEEIRQFILCSVSKTGGHLSSNLGAVELTLALHYVFDFKRDKVLWDVGHQCYTHKIVTGRKDKFTRLRQAEGISGFPCPDESIYDQFAFGHAGTSIATAIGMALAEQLKAKDNEAAGPQNIDEAGPIEPANKIVVVIGDASIVNGESFEALNNLGLVKRQLLIVLNDNSMAIDQTVGSLAKYFLKVRLSQTYDDMRRTTKNILTHVPGIGKSVDEAVERLKKTIRMVLPPSQIFESLNIPYFGPVDGHDIGSLTELFKTLSEANHPVLLHIFTKKGKGFQPADIGPSKFHSTGPFKINGDSVASAASGGRQTFTDVFGERLAELAEKDARIVAITSAMCDGTGLGRFRQMFPDRFYDVGIAESAAVDIAAGLARSGLKPVVCIYSTFLQRSFDQISQEVSLQNLPVVFCIDRAGVVGPDGPTHHGLMDIGYLRMLPNMVLTAPASAGEMRLAVEFALSHDGPVVIRYPKDFVPPEEVFPAALGEPFVLGKSVTVRKPRRSSITIVSYGSILIEVLKAARRLATEAISVDVINARFAVPVDPKIISLLQSGKSIITVEEHSLACGFGSAVLELAADKGLCGEHVGTLRILGAPRRFIGHNSRIYQLMEAGINADEIVNTAKQLLQHVQEKVKT